MAAGHVDPTIKTNVQNNTVANAVIDATVIKAWRDEISNKIDDNYDSSQTKLPLLTGTISPVFNVTPAYVGQIYTNRITGDIYTSTGLTSVSWKVTNTKNSMYQQAWINAAFEVWQQGTSFTNPSNNAYTADMMSVTNSITGTPPTSIVHSRNTLTSGLITGAKYAYNINFNGAGSGYGANDVYGVSQKIEFGTSKLCGLNMKVAVSLFIKSDVANKRVAVSMTQNYGTGGSPSAAEVCSAPPTTSIVTLGSNYALYTFTFTTNTLTGKTFGTNNDDYLQVTILGAWGSSVPATSLGGGTAETFVGSGNITFTEVVVNAGDIYSQYQPKSFDDELKSCQRYYEKSYSYAVSPATSSTTAGIENKVVPSNTIASMQNYGTTRFKVAKRTTPTIVIYPYTTGSNTGRVSDDGPGTDLAAGSGSTRFTNDSSFATYNGSGGSVTTVSLSISFHWTADARL